MSEILEPGDFRFSTRKEDRTTEKNPGETTRKAELKVNETKSQSDKIKRIWGELLFSQIDKDHKIDMYSFEDSTGKLILYTSHDGYVPSYIANKPNIEMSENTVKWEIEN